MESIFYNSWFIRSDCILDSCRGSILDSSRDSGLGNTFIIGGSSNCCYFTARCYYNRLRFSD